MANNIDRRVVEMQFNNSQFESGVQQSTQSLNNLKQSLDFSGAANSVNNLSNNFDTSNLNRNVDATANSFQRFKSDVPNSIRVAASALTSFGKLAAGVLTGVTTLIGGMAMKGGITRAMNLKQANFMLRGLLGDTEKGQRAVARIMDDVNESVDGTAYSLDQAAIVASQFAATGMRGGEKMLGALRGVAGVAAMTGAEYSRVGEIFTQVSGQGRLMGNDLLQLSGYGMNAAATLTDFFNKVNKGKVETTKGVKEAVKEISNGSQITEGDLRDFVSKGKISFEIFAAAMDNAFGDHATKANETFSGALANMKSALSRIGEKIASPAIDALRDIFNALRPLINALNVQLTPALTALGEKITSIGGKATDFLEKIGGAEKLTKDFLAELDFNAYTDLVGYLKKVHDGSIEASDDVLKVAESFKKSDEITEQSVRKLVNNRKLSFDTLKKATDEGAKSAVANSDLLEKYSTKDKKAAETLADYFNQVNKGNIKASDSIKKTIEDLTKGKEITAKTAEELVKQEKITYELLGSALGKNIWESPLHDWSIFGELIKSLKNLAWNVKDVFTALKGAFLDVFPKTSIENIRDLVEKFNAFSFTARISEKTINNLGMTFRGLFSIISIFGKIIGTFSKLLYPLVKALGSVASFILSITGRIGNAIFTFNKMIEGTRALGDAFDYLLSIGTALQKVFSSLVDSFVDVISASIGIKDLTKATEGKGEVISKSLHTMGEGFKSIGNAISEFLHGIDFSFITKILTGGIIYKLSMALSSFLVLLKKTAFSLASIGIGPIFDNLRQTLILYQSRLRAEVLIKQAAAIAILAGSLLVLSMIDAKKLATSVAAMGALFLMLTKSVESLLAIEISGGAASLTGLWLLGGVLRNLAISVAILSLALKGISELSIKELIKGLLGIVALSGIMVGVAAALSHFGKQMIRGSGGLFIFAAAIATLAPSLKEFGSMDLDSIGRGLLGLASTIAIMVMALGVLSSIKGSVKSAAGIFILASAIKLLAPAFKEFGSMNLENIGHGLLGLASSISVLVLALAAMSAVKGSIKASISLLIMASAIKGVADAIDSLSYLELGEVGRSLLAFSTGLAAMVLALAAMSAVKGSVKASLSLYIMITAISGLADAMKSFGSMNIDKIGRSLLALSTGLAALIMALGVMSTMGAKGIASAASLLIIANAVNTLAPAIQKLGSMSLPQIGVALLAIAGAFTILGLAGLLLSPILPAILLLSAAISAIGVACAAAGAGITLFGTGLATLISMGPMAVQSVVMVFTEIAKSIPEIIHVIVQGIVALATEIGSNAFKLAEAGVKLIIAFLSAINNKIASIIDIGLQICINFINGIANNLPSIIQAGMNLMISFINGMAEGIRNSQEFIFSAVGNLMGAIINFVLSFLQILAEEVPVIGDFLSGGLEKAKQKVDEKLNPEYAKQKAKEFSEGYSSGVDESAEQAGKSGEKLADNAAKGADKSDYFKKAASKAGNVYNTDLGKAAQKAKGIGVKFPENAGKGADRVSAFQSAANKAGDKYNSALKNKARSARTAGSDLATNAKSGMDSVTGFYDVGVDGAQGFVNGASSKDTSAYNAGLSLAGQFKQAIIDKLDSHSPSRETYKLGYFGLIGFVNAVNDNLKLARNSGVGIANALLSGLKDTSREISASIDGVDLIPNQPVIKPVVDLSGVRAASDDINSMFLNTNAINATASIGNVASSNIDANFKMEALFRKLGDKIDALSESNNNLDPAEIYNAIFMGASNAQPSVRLNERELGRGLQDMGVAFR